MKRNLFFVTASVLALSATAAMASDNTVYLDQGDSAQQATITQEGAYNKVGNDSWFKQSASAVGDVGNELIVSQTSTSYNDTVNGYQKGDHNTAGITQIGTNSNIRLEQNGAANSSDIQQGGNANWVWAYQLGPDEQHPSGSSNKLVVRQAVSSYPLYGSGNNQINSYQYSSSNDATFTQFGSYNEIKSTQYGNQKATISQIGYYNRTEGGQSGALTNTVDIKQGVDGYDYGTNNYANYSQIGSGLVLNLVQTGNANVSYTKQAGVGSTANITQR